MSEHTSHLTNRQADNDGRESAAPIVGTEWLPLLQACQLVFESSKDTMDMVFVEMARLLKLGKIHAVVRTVERQSGKIRVYPVPIKIWEEIGATSAHGLQPKLRKWSKKKHAEGTLPDGWPDGSPRIYVKRSDLERNFMASTMADGTPSQRKPGRKNELEWRAFAAAALHHAVENQKLEDVNVAAISRDICGLYGDKAPSDSQVRAWIGMILLYARGLRNSG